MGALRRAPVPGALRPTRHDSGHALRVAVSLLVPGLMLIAWGRPELLVYAAFGAFASMYGRGEVGRARIVHQLQAGGLLTVGVVLGVMLSELSAAPWVLVAVAVVFSTVGSVLSDAVRLKPAGPFYFLFAMGATATVPPGHARPVEAIGICVITALFAVIVGSIGTPDPFRGRPWWAGIGMVVRRPAPGVHVHAVRYAVAVGIAGAIGMALGLGHANWAMAAAAVPLAAIDASRPSERAIRPVLTRASHRTFGTLIGLALTAGLFSLDVGPAALALIAIVMLYPTELFMTRHYAIAIGFFTPLVLIMTELAAPSDPLDMLVNRAVDTIVGVVVGIAVAALVRPRTPSA